MKNRVLICLWAAILLSLAGCTYYPPTSVAPGSVLGTSQDGGSQKIVTFKVIGKGLEPETALTKSEAVLMAERAAVADGYRQFAEKIYGVYVDAYLKAGYGNVNHEAIKTHTQTWLRGIEVIEIKEGNYGIMEAHMQLRVNFVKNGMVWWPTGIGSANAVTSKTESVDDMGKNGKDVL